MTLVNGLLNRTFDLLLRPLQPLSPPLALAVVSALTAAAMLGVVRLTSNQPAIAAVKRQIHADLFEIRLFNDDLRAMARAEMDILRHNAAYLRLSLAPLLWMAVPLVLVVAQLQAHFGYSGDPLETFLVTANLKSSDPVSATLDPAPGFHADADGIWFPAVRQVVWRVTPAASGLYTLRLRINGQPYEKTLRVDGPIARRSPVRPRAGFLDQIEYPSEPPIAGDRVESITVAYPERRFDLLGLELSWVTLFVVESLAFAVLLRRPFGVTL